MQAPLVPVTLVFLLGILLGEYAAPHSLGVELAGLVSALAVLGGRRRAKTRRAALLALWLCLGALRMAAWQAHPEVRLRDRLRDEPQAVQVHGVIVDDPTPHFTCTLALRHRRDSEGWVPIRGKVWMTWGQTRGLTPTYGDEIVTEGTWSRVPPPGNPGQYDWQAALARKRIHGLLRVRAFDGLVVLQRGKGNTVLAAVFRLRQRWERLIRAHFDTRDAGLLLGLLLGHRAEIDEELKEAFTTTGTIHLVPTQMGRKPQAAPSGIFTCYKTMG